MNNNLFRLFVVAGFGFLAALLLLIGVAQHDENLLAPANFLMAMVTAAVYLLPTAVAVYRDCESRVWIVLLNIFLGWTIVGWIIALSWANGGKIRPIPPAGHPPTHPLPTR